MGEYGSVLLLSGGIYRTQVSSMYIFQQIEKAGSAKTTKSGGIMDIGVNVLPKLPRDAGDRNRCRVASAGASANA